MSENNHSLYLADSSLSAQCVSMWFTSRGQHCGRPGWIKP